MCGNGARCDAHNAASLGLGRKEARATAIRIMTVSGVLDAEVRQQERIDACGDILEGWRVNAVIQSSASDTPITYNYIIAPQFGAVPLYEEVERQSADGTAKLRFTLGQKDPSPVTPQEEQGEG